MTREEMIEQLENTILLIKQNGKDWGDERDIPVLEGAIKSLQPKIGRWILSGGYWRCSECKEKALLTFDKSKGGCREYEPVKSKYCPNCGCAMMEEGE